ncbi:hypothetical protein OD757_06890 [Acinetobacter sp. AYS6]|nr:hypothetical protein [Acinetobacter sp. AYS6]MCU7696945.1 hypothetical protein [Acinetobacter sp. AYS6]
MVKSLKELLSYSEYDLSAEEYFNSSIEREGDLLLLKKEFQKAVEQYSNISDFNINIAEKYAWCLYHLECWSDLVNTLEHYPIDELSELAKTILAIGLMEGWNRSYSITEEVRLKAQKLLDQVIASDTVPRFAVYARCDLWFTRNDEIIKAKLASNMVKKIPDSFYFRKYVAKQRKHLLMSDHDALICLQEGFTYNEEYAGDSYLWLIVELAISVCDYDLALKTLRTLETNITSTDNNIDVLIIIKITTAWILYLQGSIEEAVHILETILLRKSYTENYSNQLVSQAFLYLIDINLRSKDINAIKHTVEKFFDVMNVTPENIQEIAESSELLGPFWFTDGELIALEPIYFEYNEELLKQALSDKKLGLILWFFVLRERLSGFDSDQKVDRILKAANLVQHPALDSILVTDCYMEAEPIPWRLIGEAWTRSSLYLFDLHGSSLLSNSPLEDVEKFNKKNITDFAKGMLIALESVNQFVGVHEIFSIGLRQQLLDREMNDLFLKLARAVASIDSCQSSWFDHALGEQRTGDKLTAIRLYWNVLEAEKLHFSALFNLLLLYTNYPDAEKVNEIAHIIENSEETDFSPEQLTKLESILSKAKDALKPSPEAIRAAAVERTLLKWSSIVSICPEIDKIELNDALALLMLLRVSPSISKTFVLDSLDKGIQPFTPTLYHRKLLFSLLNNQYIALDHSSPSSAFIVEDGEVVSYYLGKMRWRISNDILYLAKKIEQIARSKDWPHCWYEQVYNLAKELAVEECIAYFNYLADERNFPEPDPEKTKLLFDGLLVDFSVSQCYYLSYLSAQAASDYKQKLPVSTAQAANVMILRCQQKADRARNEKWEVKRYSRPRDITRSSMSEVLHDIFTGLGEKAFSDPLGTLNFPLVE